MLSQIFHSPEDLSHNQRVDYEDLHSSCEQKSVKLLVFM